MCLPYQTRRYRHKHRLYRRSYVRNFCFIFAGFIVLLAFSAGGAWSAGDRVQRHTENVKHLTKTTPVFGERLVPVPPKRTES